MTIAETLQALRALPADAEVTLSVKVSDLRAALEAQDDNPARRIGTSEASDLFGRSREWWADQAPKIDDAVQEGPGAPWYFAIGAARDYLIQYENDRRTTRTRSRARGPWKAGGRP